MEFRGEFFDAWNTPYFAPPGNNIGSPTDSVGRLTQANDGRDIQFGLKIRFLILGANMDAAKRPVNRALRCL